MLDHPVDLRTLKQERLIKSVRLNSFVETKHVLDGIHEGRFAVLIAI
jgi:hypothetical protein